MDINVADLKKLLCDRLCQDVDVEERPDGDLMVRTHFSFPDGDGYPFHLTSDPAGGLRISDRGHTLMHLSYDQDIDRLMNGPRRLLLDRIVQESGMEYEDGAFSIAMAPERLAESVFLLGQGLTRVYDLSLLSRETVASTFNDDLAKTLTRFVGESLIQENYEPNVPNAQYYQVDYCIEGRDVPLFVWGVPNRDKARLTTIMLSYFHLRQLPFESIIVFRDLAAIPGNDLARLADVAGEMVSSLDRGPDLQRKLSRRVALPEPLN